MPLWLPWIIPGFFKFTLWGLFFLFYVLCGNISYVYFPKCLAIPKYLCLIHFFVGITRSLRSGGETEWSPQVNPNTGDGWQNVLHQEIVRDGENREMSFSSRNNHTVKQLNEKVNVCVLNIQRKYCPTFLLSELIQGNTHFHHAYIHAYIHTYLFTYIHT